MVAKPQKPARDLKGHRKSTRSTTVVPAGARPEVETPPPPASLDTVRARELWAALWSSKLAAVAWHSPLDRMALERYVVNFEQWHRWQARVKREPMVTGSMGQKRHNPLIDKLRVLEGELRTTEEHFGLTPLSRMRLGIAFEEAASGLERLAGLYQTPETEGGAGEYVED